MTAATEKLLTPQNCVIAFIDHQPQMSFGVQSHDLQTVKNNTIGLAKGAKIFDVPTILSTVETEIFSGYTWPELVDALKGQQTIERSSMNAWEDESFVIAVRASGRKKLILSGLWTEVCIAFPTICALDEGFEVYFVSDTCGGTSKEAHEMSIAMMIQAGAQPRTWQQVVLEWQRDWSRKETYDEVTHLLSQVSGAYGMGIDYAKTILHKAPQRAEKPQMIQK